MSHKFNVIKLGGSSITYDGFSNLLQYLDTSKKHMIILSAPQGVTDYFVRYTKTKNDINIKRAFNKTDTIIKQLEYSNLDFYEEWKEMVNENLDDDVELISLGETLSVVLFQCFLSENNIIGKNIEAIDIIHNIDDSYMFDNDFFEEELENDINIYITQGFVYNKNGEKHLMTRGGSDTSAAIIANGLESSELEIWTDVSGVYTADPRIVPNAQIIKSLDYDLVQELSAMGAKVLHPFCIKPCQAKNIKIKIRNSYDTDYSLTTEINDIMNLKDLIVTCQKDNTLFRVISENMWNDYGFVGEIFSIFKEYSIDINIISTSQFMVSFTTQLLEQTNLDNIVSILEEKYKVEVVPNCHIVSLVGNKINKKNLNDFFKIVNGCHLLHNSANNMSMSAVVNGDESTRIINELHKKYVYNFRKQLLPLKWIRVHRDQLIECYKQNGNSYYYNLEYIKNQCRKLKKLKMINEVFYAMKANNKKQILKTIIDEGVNIECVSLQELIYIKKIFPKVKTIFTPNFCNTIEYIEGLKLSDIVIVDSLEVITNHLDIFTNKRIGIRLDLNLGKGHHEKVITQGKTSKFGILEYDLEQLALMCFQNNIHVIGLHSHQGSGIQAEDSWIKVINRLCNISDKYFDEVEWINCGGGLGVSKENKLDLTLIDTLISTMCPNLGNKQLFLEPGRYLVAQSGVIVTQVTNVKTKFDINYLGIGVGMNNIIRPTLYDAYHPIYNISKLNSNATKVYTIVGPICETGDILGKNLLMSESNEGDIIVIEECGAYVESMRSDYNMRNIKSLINFTNMKQVESNTIRM